MQRDAAYAICRTVSTIEHRAQIEHREHSLHCCEPCRASDQSTAVEILDRLAAIDSLCCSDEPGVSVLKGLRQCWSYAFLLLNFIGNNAHQKQSFKTYTHETQNRIDHPGYLAVQLHLTCYQ